MSGGGGGLRAKYGLPCKCIRDSLYFGMQHERVLKKLNLVGGGWVGGERAAGKIVGTMLLHL